MQSVQRAAAQPGRYRPWPEGVPYEPGVGAAPPLKQWAEEEGAEAVAEVGNVPSLTGRSGDPRCEDVVGFAPCSRCTNERVAGYEASSRRRVLPGLPPGKALGKHWFTGMPSRHPHPFAESSEEMNLGQGCDTHGTPYARPERYTYLQVFEFSDEVEDYELSRGCEIDWGPGRSTEEFKKGMQTMRGTESFSAYADQRRQRDPDWEWREPTDVKPYEKVGTVEPNIWRLEQPAPKQPLDQHAEEVRAWAAARHVPWN